MMGKRMPETCLDVFKRWAINLRDWCIRLVDLFECMMMDRLTNPKNNLQVYIICKDKISHFQLTVPIPEKKHMWMTLLIGRALDVIVHWILVYLSVCMCVCACVSLRSCVWYLISSWQTHCRMWPSLILVFRSTLRHKLERTNYCEKECCFTKECGNNEMCY